MRLASRLAERDQLSDGRPNSLRMSLMAASANGLILNAGKTDRASRPVRTAVRGVDGERALRALVAFA
jgi:hypothetical protein